MEIEFKLPAPRTCAALNELMTDEEIEIRRQSSKLRRRARCRGLNSYIDPFWMRYMLRRDGITIWDIGRGRNDYCLARYGDQGDYTVENARYITVIENIQERKTYTGEWTPERRQAASERLKNRQRDAQGRLV